MASFDIIGGVSVTLKRLLEDRLDTPVDAELPGQEPKPRVTISTPRELKEDTPERPRVNLFLYRVTQNGFLANDDLPGRAPGAGYGQPPLSLDLHYLMTAYGTTAGQQDNRENIDERLAHYALGSAMRVFHDVAVITDQLETRAGQPLVHPSLIGEFERVKLSLEPITLDDIQKIWTALNTPYRVSAAYEASVVQIESRLRRTYPKLVGAPPGGGTQLTSAPARNPQISDVRSRRPGDDPGFERPQSYARIGDSLVLRGTDLAGEHVQVRLGPVDATDQVTSVSEDRISVTVPDDPELAPGAQAVRVAFPVPVGDPPELRAGAESNMAAFVLVPEVRRVAFSAPQGQRRIEVTGVRLFDEEGDSTTIVGAEAIEADRYLASTPTRIVVPLPTTVPRGDAPVRVRVNGAESLDDVTVAIP